MPCCITADHNRCHPSCHQNEVRWQLPESLLLKVGSSSPTSIITIAVKAGAVYATSAHEKQGLNERQGLLVRAAGAFCQALELHALA